MTPEEAKIWNSAINAAIRAYPKGIGAIRSLRVNHVVVVEHVGRSTKQEVVEIEV